MLDRNDLLLEKNRRTTIYVFAAVLILWCIFTLFVSYAFVLLLHAKFEEDLASKTAANMQNIEEIIRGNVQSIIDQEIQKMWSKKCANSEISNEDDQSIQRELIFSSSFEQTHQVTRLDNDEVNRTDASNGEKHYRSAAELKGKRLLEMHPTKPVFTTEPTLKSPTIHSKIGERTYTTYNETSIYNTTSQSRIFKRGAEAFSASVSISTTNSVETNNRLPKVYNEHDPSDEDYQNGTFFEQNSRLKQTSTKSDAVEIADRQAVNVHVKSKKNSGRSSKVAKVVDIEDGDSHEHAHIESNRVRNEEKKLWPSSKLVEGTRSSEIDVVVAVHLGADSSSFKTQKQYYKQNDLVRHPTGDYQEWKVDNWYYDLQMYKYVNFTLGGMMIQRAGLYFVYGQMYFTDHADINGFVITKNNETFLQCVTSYNGDRSKTELSNTCYTGGLVLCKKGDELRIRGAHPGRSVVLETSRSFFGMFKLKEGSWESI